MRKLLWPLGLFFLTVALRMPFMTRHFFHLDVAQFSLGMLRYDISKHMPHPPGYFFLVHLGKLLYLMTGKANLSFTLLAVFFSGLAVAFIYSTVRSMMAHQTGLFAALLLISNPLFWAMGETGFSYAEGAFIGAFAGFFSYRAYKGNIGFWGIIAAGMLIGASGGLRPSDVFLMAPLWLYGVLHGKRRWQAGLVALLSMKVGLASWFVPTMFLGHGGGTSWRHTIEWIRTAGILAPFKTYLIMNLGKMVAANLWCVAGGLILLPFVLRRRIFCSFFILWILPGILFQLVVGYGNVAHCLVYGVSYSAILAIVSSQAKPWKYLAIALNSLIFFLWPHLPSDNLVNYSVNYISPFYQNLRARDVTTAQVLDLIKANPEMDIISIRDRRGIGEYYEGPGCSVLRWEFQKRSILSLIYLPDRTMTSWFNGTEQISKPAKLSDSVIVVVERGNEKTLDMIGRRWLFRIGETYAGVVPCDELEKSLAGIVIF